MRVPRLHNAQEEVMFDRPFLRSRGLRVVSAAALGIALAILGGRAFSAQDKYTLRVPNGLAFSDFRGYENWQVVAVSQTETLLKVMVVNPIVIDAYRAGVPGNGRPFRTLQDCKNRMETKTKHGGCFFREGAGHIARYFLHRKEQPEIPSHEGMGVRRV
jgi:hypothetical protein